MPEEVLLALVLLGLVLLVTLMPEPPAPGVEVGPEDDPEQALFARTENWVEY